MGVTELLVVLVLVGLFMAAGMPSLLDYYRSHRFQTATNTIQDLVRFARVRAIKQRTAHRVLVHDESGSPNNTIEIQVEAGGSFATLPDYVFTVPDGIRILGSGATDSLDSLAVDKRGHCTTGQVYVEGHNGRLAVIDIEPTCFTSTS